MQVTQSSSPYAELMKGPITKRQWRDIPWIVLFTLGFIAFIVIFVIEKGQFDDWFKKYLDGHIPNEITDDLKNNIIAWFVAIGIPLGVGLIFLLITPYLAGCVIWTMIIIRICLFVGAGVVCFMVISNILGILLGGICLLVALILVITTYCIRNQIRIGIILIKAAGTYFLQNLYIIAVPALCIGMYFAFLMLFYFSRYYTTWIIEIGKNSSDSKDKSNGDLASIFQVYQIFFGYWASYLFFGLCILGVAVSASIWYFQQDLGQNVKPIDNKFIKSLCWPLSYHIGSISLGALILALLDMLDMVIDYKNAKKSSNPILKLFGCLLNKCIECIKHLNKIALIMVGMTGESFCSSALKGFKLVGEQFLQYVVLQKIKKMYLNAGAMVMILLSGFLSIYLYINKLPDDPNYGTVFANIIILLIICGAITWLILNIIGTAADVCLFCLTVDKQINGCAKKGPRIMAEIDKDNQIKGNFPNKAPVQQQIAMTSLNTSQNETFIIQTPHQLQQPMLQQQNYGQVPLNYQQPQQFHQQLQPQQFQQPYQNNYQQNPYMNNQNYNNQPRKN